MKTNQESIAKAQGEIIRLESEGSQMMAGAWRRILERLLKKIACERCNGTGEIHCVDIYRCPECNGTGKLGG